MLRIKKLILGLLLSIACTGVLFTVLSLIMLKTGLIPQAPAAWLALALAALSVLFGAVVTAHAAGERGLLHGTVLAAGYSILYILAALILTPQQDILPLLLRSMVFLLCGAIGGILGVGGSESKVKF